MYSQSKFPTRVAPTLRLPNGQTPVVYGDPAYFLGTGVIGAFRNHRYRDISDDERRFNQHMSRQRMSVEWGFGKAVMQWGFISHKANFKVGLSPVRAYYAVCILLSNVHTWYWGSATGVKFNCNPPTIYEYLHF
ncbi:hypothetical protein HOY82DRAFT_492016 [Tuber indicum]|nr:hypothetical protein HOY82DRAFT_492016 [Tuber indicum]